MRIAILFVLSCCSFVGSAPKGDALVNWGQWRGPLGTGVAPKANPPLEWSEEKNVRWKTELPGKGHSSPIVWKDRLFLTSAIPFGDRLPPKFSGAPGAHDNLPITRKHKFAVLCVDRANGKILWQKIVHKALPHEGGHVSGSLASASPVTDGAHVFAHFGSYGLYCLDFDGKLVWKKPLGKMNTKHGHGEGASPALFGDTLVVNWDHEGDSFVVALDKKTGKQRWKADREEVTSWATPVIVEVGDSVQVVVPGTKRMRGYDLKTGKVLWECGGLSANIVATPVTANGILFAGSSYEIRAMLAIRLAGAKGDITNTKSVLWKTAKVAPYVPSPLLVENTLYFFRHYQAILSVVDGKTGKDVGDSPYRLPGIRNVYASPVAASKRIYLTDRNGATLVLSHGDSPPKVLAVNRIGDSVNASAALVGSELFLRGEKVLYCIRESK